jgi:alkyldihydroxyacetonephosphate synthase
VLPDGQILHVRPAPRRAVGPDVIGAFIGARGRLGIVTAVHLVSLPQAGSTPIAFSFEEERDALATLAWIRGSGVRPRTSELTETNERTWLLLDVDGDARLRRARLSVVRRVAAEHGGTEEDPESAPPRLTREQHASPPDVTERIARLLDPSGTLR